MEALRGVYGCIHHAIFAALSSIPVSLVLAGSHASRRVFSACLVAPWRKQALAVGARSEAHGSISHHIFLCTWDLANKGLGSGLHYLDKAFVLFLGLLVLDKELPEWSLAVEAVELGDCRVKQLVIDGVQVLHDLDALQLDLHVVLVSGLSVASSRDDE